ncbi:MAG: MAE_28990/MAE_18760 family HEPN-like nuclease [Phycisphaerae bacterium]
MQKIREKMEERTREIQAYVRLLKHIETRLGPHTKRKKRVGDLPAGESFTSMKAASFLMLYNLVESTVKGAVAEIYEEIKRKRCTVYDVSQCLQGQWVDQQFWIAPHEATPTTYRKRTAQILQDAMDKKPLSLAPEKLNIGGNIDADAVRKICRDHGVTLQVYKRAKGGTELDTVKDQRNALAHGTISFVECGRNYTVSDMKRISAECLNFTKGFVRSVDRFIKNGGYRKSSDS